MDGLESKAPPSRDLREVYKAGQRAGDRAEDGALGGWPCRPREGAVPRGQEMTPYRQWGARGAHGPAFSQTHHPSSSAQARWGEGAGKIAGGELLKACAIILMVA